MHVIIFGANGGLGQWTWKAAIDAGHDVVAFVRSPGKLDSDDPRFSKLTVVQGDVTDAEAVRRACEGREVAINCTSPAGGNATLELAKSMVGPAGDAGIKTFYMVGGLGALWAPGTDRGVLVQDWDDPEGAKRFGFPPGMPRDRIQAMTKGHLASMAFMASTGHAHTFLCPGMMVEGPASSTRVVTLDELGGQSPMRVNFGDVAQTIVEDLGRGQLLGHRVSVASS